MVEGNRSGERERLELQKMLYREEFVVYSGDFISDVAIAVGLILFNTAEMKISLEDQLIQVNRKRKR